MFPVWFRLSWEYSSSPAPCTRKSSSHKPAQGRQNNSSSQSAASYELEIEGSELDSTRMSLMAARTCFRPTATVTGDGGGGSFISIASAGDKTRHSGIHFPCYECKNRGKDTRRTVHMGEVAHITPDSRTHHVKAVGARRNCARPSEQLIGPECNRLLLQRKM